MEMLAEMQQDAESLYAAGEYDHALAEFSVLREMRSRREGPYSVSYLANVHDCVRCMSALELWADSNPLCHELYGKYVHTHGRGEADTVDVAKHWAWALVHLADYARALRLYVLTADALWDTDPAQARRLLGAAAVHRHDTDPTTLLADDRLDGVPIHHAGALGSTLAEFISTTPPADVAQLPERVTIDGLLY